MQRSYWQKSQTIRLPRIMQLRVETLGRVTEDLLTKSRRPPTLEELSEYSNLSIAQVKEVMGFTYDVLSLDVAFSEDDKGKVLGELIPIDDFDLELVDDKLGYSYASERLVEIIYEVLDQITADIIIQRFGLVRTPSQSVDAIEKHFDYSTHEIARRARQGLQVLLLTKEAELEALRDLVTLDLRSVAAEDLSLEPNEGYRPAAGQPIADARQISWVNELRDFLIAQGGIFENQLGRGFNMDLGQKLGWSKRRVSQVVKIMREAGLITAYTKTTSPSSHVYKIELAQASATEPV